MSIDHKHIEALAALLEKHALTEIEVNNEETSIRLCKHPAPIHAAAPLPHHAPNQHQPEPSESVKQEAAGIAITSPMVGTVYLSPSPGADAFVSIGQTVQKGDVLCLIEAMKMFNKIKAEKSGVIKHISVKNEQPIEFGAELFRIEEC